MPTEARSYLYDPIGNRQTALDQDGATTVNYVSNQVNQYDNIDGTMLAYDLDGNMLSDRSGMTLTYNGENRLVHAERQGAFAADYTYDYLGRRVRKAVDSDDDGDIDFEVFYVFDGWNVVREVRKDAGVVIDTKRYVWGLDLSGSMQGAGGIGGLLAVVDGDQQVFTFDGNGNVSELLDASDGTQQAHYEYDAFGNVVVMSGPGAEGNAWRFSTKPVDEESGFVMFELRPYGSRLGRWIQRDSIGELVGLSRALRRTPRAQQEGLRQQALGPAYAFVGNDPANQTDNLGEGLALLAQKKLGRQIPLAVGISAGGSFLSKFGPDGLVAGAQSAIEFFPDSCELAVFHIKAGLGHIVDRLVEDPDYRTSPEDPLATPNENGIYAGLSVAVELAYYHDNPVPGQADANSFTGIFHTAHASFWGGLSLYVGDRDANGGQWYGGTFGLGPDWGAGILDWDYQITWKTKLDDCVCKAAILAL